MTRKTDAGVCILAIAVFLAVLAGVSGKGRSQSAHDNGHALHHGDAYRHWMRPHMPSVSCCSARKTVDGETTGDCRPTAFRITRTAGWQAQLDDGSWIDVPDSRILREKNPDQSGVTGHLCESYGVVHCAVPPVGSL